MKKSRTLLQSGLIIAPIAAFAVSFLHGMALSIALLLIAIPTVLISALIPRRIPFAVRIVLYSVIGSLVYMPAAVLTANIVPQIAGGIYIPLLCTPLYLTVHRDDLFPHGHVLRSMIRHLIPACLFILAVGVIREILGSGSIIGHSLISAPPLPILLEPSGGLILLVIGLAACSANSRKEATDANRL